MINKPPLNAMVASLFTQRHGACASLLRSQCSAFPFEDLGGSDPVESNATNNQSWAKIRQGVHLTCTSVATSVSVYMWMRVPFVAQVSMNGNVLSVTADRYLQLSVGWESRRRGIDPHLVEISSFSR